MASKQSHGRLGYRGLGFLAVWRVILVPAALALGAGVWLAHSAFSHREAAGEQARPEVDGLAAFGVELLHRGPGVLANVQRTDDRKAHLDERRPGDVGPRHGFLLNEAVMGQHRQQTVCRRVGHAKVFARVGQADPWLFAEEK